VIRVATTADLEQGMALFHRFREEGIFSIFKVNEEKARAYFEGLVSRQRVLVADEDGVLVGAIAADVHTYPFTDDPILQQQFVYVIPEWRKARLGVILIRHLIDLAERAHMPLFFGVSTGTDVDRLGMLLQRLGFKCIGGMYAAGV